MKTWKFIQVMTLLIVCTITGCKTSDEDYSLNAIEYTLKQYGIVGVADKYPDMHSISMWPDRTNMIHMIVAKMTKEEFDEYRKANSFGEKNAYVHSHGFPKCFDSFWPVTPRDTNLYQKVVGNIEYCTTYDRNGMMYLNINNYDKDNKYPNQGMEPTSADAQSNVPED